MTTPNGRRNFTNKLANVNIIFLYKKKWNTKILVRVNNLLIFFLELCKSKNNSKKNNKKTWNDESHMADNNNNKMLTKNWRVIH